MEEEVIQAKTDEAEEEVIQTEPDEVELTEKEKVKRCLAYMLSIVAYLTWCHFYTSDQVGNWIAERWELLLAGSGILTAVASSTKGTGDDTIISAGLKILSERFSPRGLRR